MLSRTVTAGTIVLTFVLLATSPPLQAQSSSPSAAPGSSANREQEVLAVVKKLFDGMRAGDSAVVRSVDPDVKFVSVTMRGDSSRIQNEALNEFVQAIGAPQPQVLDERLKNTKVFVDADLATVWTEYDFYVGDRFSHCGVDSFQLVRRPQGWKIVALADTRRRQGCGQ